MLLTSLFRLSKMCVHESICTKRCYYLCGFYLNLSVFIWYPKLAVAFPVVTCHRLSFKSNPCPVRQLVFRYIVITFPYTLQPKQYCLGDNGYFRRLCLSHKEGS